MKRKHAVHLLLCLACFKAQLCITMNQVHLKALAPTSQHSAALQLHPTCDDPTLVCCCAGALLLLQETGQSNLVIELGTDWLAAKAESLQSCDVAAATALAHCDKAGSALLADNSMVAPACQHLEIALDLLQTYDLAPDLQQQISDTMQVGNKQQSTPQQTV